MSDSRLVMALEMAARKKKKKLLSAPKEKIIKPDSNFHFEVPFIHWIVVKVSGVHFGSFIPYF